MRKVCNLMNNLHAFFDSLLNTLPNWEVSNVRINEERQRVEITISSCEETERMCPICGHRNVDIQKRENKEFRSLPILHYQSYFIVEEVWVYCPQHGLQKYDLPGEQDSGQFALGARIF